MKKNLCLCAFAFFALCGCSGVEEAPRPATLFIHVTGIGEDMAGTRVLSQDSGNEYRVKNLQVLVFSTGGQLDGYARSDNSSAAVKCVSGDKRVKVLVNAPDLSGVKNLSELSQFVFRLSDNTPASLLMAGEKSVRVEGNSYSEIDVERICAKVMVNKLTKGFSSAVLQGKTLTIDRMYITNVCGQASLSSSFTPSDWLNKMGYSGDCDNLLCDNVGKTLSSTLTESHTFYVYPNSVLSDTRGGSWQARYSRLVIESTLDGQKQYYVIDIPGIEGNHSYIFSEIVFTRRGGDDEESVPAESNVSFSCSVAPWQSKSPYTENL